MFMKNLEEKKIPPTSNQYINTLIDKKNNKNETHSNLTNLINHNDYSSQIQAKNNSNKKIELKKILPVTISNNIANTVVSKNKLVVLNNDVIVSGNEINTEKIYINKNYWEVEPSAKCRWFIIKI